MIRHNLAYKLMALGVALSLWSYVNTERNPQSRRTFTVPIQIAHDDGYVADPEVRDAIITVQGAKSVVDAISREDVNASIDLAKAGGDTASSAILTVTPSIRDIEGDIEVSISPKKVRVKIEQSESKRLPVEVRFPAVPPLGFAYSNPTINPASVSIKGKISDVARVERVVLTLPSEMNRASIDDSFPITPLDSEGVPVTGVTLDANKVRLKLQLLEVPASKTVIVSPDVIGVPAFPAKVTKVSVAPSLITLQGRPSALAGITTIDTDLIDVDGTTGKVIREVSLHMPAGVTTTGRSTVRVTVEVSSPEP